MRRLLRWTARFLESRTTLRTAVRLFPRSWRERYGEEFFALLEDTHPKWTDVWDIAKEALVMQTRRLAALTLMGALVGGLAGGLIARNRPSYRLSAVLSISAPGEDRASAVNRLAQAAFSDDALRRIMDRWQLSEPTNRLREGIRIAPVVDKPDQFTLEVAGRSPHLAAELRTALVSRLIDANLQSGIGSVQLVGPLPPSFRPPLFNPRLIIPFWTIVGALLGWLLSFLRRAPPANL